MEYLDLFCSYFLFLDDYDDDCNDPPYSSRGGRGRGAGRRVLKLGIGGFHVRVPRQRLPVNTPDEKEKEAQFLNSPAEEEDQSGPPHITPERRKMRRPRRPRRPKIEESYPPAIQEAFFGIQPVDSKSLIDVVVDEPVLGEHYNVKLEDKNRNLGCELSDQAADQLRVDDLGLDELLNDDIGIDITDLSLFMDDDEDINATSTNQFDGGFNPGTAGISGAFGDDKHHFDGNFMEHNDENNAEEDGDMLTNEQFHAQMEQSHEKQRQIQQQARLQMGTGGQTNGQPGTENGNKSTANLSNAERINQG